VRGREGVSGGLLPLDYYHHHKPLLLLSPFLVLIPPSPPTTTTHHLSFLSSRLSPNEALSHLPHYLQVTWQNSLCQFSHPNSHCGKISLYAYYTTETTSDTTLPVLLPCLDEGCQFWCFDTKLGKGDDTIWAFFRRRRAGTTITSSTNGNNRTANDAYSSSGGGGGTGGTGVVKVEEGPVWELEGFWEWSVANDPSR